MTAQPGNDAPALRDVVALTDEIAAPSLARGQVGTVVELLDEEVALLEFSDDEGRAHAVAACPRSKLLVPHYVPKAA